MSGGTALAACACLVLAFAAYPCAADQWDEPQDEHLSANGRYVLKVVWPRPESLTFVERTPSGDKVLWTRGYIDEDWPPYAAYVADDGKYVVLRDRHGEVGKGKVLCFLGPKGEEIKSYELKDILTHDEILNATLTVSSLWWSSNGWFGFAADAKEFVCVTQRGTVLCFDLATGKMLDVSPRKKDEVFAQATKHIMRLSSSKDPGDRAYWASMMGTLNAKESIPRLKELLGDTASTGETRAGDGPWLECHGVRVAAAQALAEIIGPAAVPDIEPLLAGENANVRSELLYVIAGIGVDRYGEVTNPSYSQEMTAIWKRLAGSPDNDMRVFAQAQVLKRDDGTYLPAHRELLRSADDAVRRAAADDLGRNAVMADLPLIRKMFADKSEPYRAWVLTGLIRLSPPDIVAILRQCLSDEDPSVREDALYELVRRGDKAAIAAFVKEIRTLKDHSDEREGWGSEEIRAGEMCELIAQIKLQDADAALREALTNRCEAIKRPVTGALAALGDAEALKALRRYAAEGNPLDRSESIRMLGLTGDMGSVPFLKEAAKDREPFVREAALKALKVLKAN